MVGSGSLLAASASAWVMKPCSDLGAQHVGPTADRDVGVAEGVVAFRALDHAGEQRGLADGELRTSPCHGSRTDAVGSGVVKKRRAAALMP